MAASFMAAAAPPARAMSPLHLEEREPSLFETARQELRELEQALRQASPKTEKTEAPPKAVQKLEQGPVQGPLQGPEQAAALAKKGLEMLSLLSAKDLEDGRATPGETTQHILETEKRIALAGEKGASAASPGAGGF